MNLFKFRSNTDLKSEGNRQESLPNITISDSSDDFLSVGRSPVCSFYAGKSILVSGATGFIGKVLIEKILYSCPDVDKIYLLIRSSKGKSPQERLRDMTAQKPFTIRLKRDYLIEKLVAIESDLAEPRLALNDQDFKTLIERVSIVFHVAASVKFEAPLEINMLHNVVATRELLNVACDFEKLVCFVHVSTAYSNCQLRQIDERIYPMDVPSNPMRLKVTKDMIDNRPNTYTYTKAMAENVASKYAGQLNVIIVRPSIVMSAMEEPAEGWVDTINGPVGLSVLGALGILQKIKVNSEVVFDLIPVDVVANALISIAWAGTEKRSEFLPGSSPSLASLVAGENNDRARRSSSRHCSFGSCQQQQLPLQPSGNGNISTSSTVPSTNNTSAAITTSAYCYKSAVAKKVEEIERLKSLSGASGFATAISETPSSESRAASVNRPSQQQLDGTVRVFNLTTGTENPCSFYHYFSFGRDEAYQKPSTRALRPLLTIPKQKGMNPILYWIYKIFSHLLFAYIVDTLLALFGHKKMVMKAVNKMHHANEVFDFFCSNQWTFVTDNVKRLRELQSPSDRTKFNCDVRAINWKTYAKVGWLGCRRFILNEEDDTFNRAKRRYRAICCLYYTVKIVLLILITMLAKCCISSLVANSMLLIPVYGVIYLL